MAKVWSLKQETTTSAQQGGWDATSKVTTQMQPPGGMRAGGWRAVPTAVLVATKHSLTFTCRRQRQRQRQRCGQSPQQAHSRAKDGRLDCSSSK